MNQEEKQRNYEIAEALLAEQKFAPAVVVGAVAAILAAVAYSFVIARLPIAYGFAAAGIGMIVGASMQFAGRGIETKFSVVAIIYTIAGCILGNALVVVTRLNESGSADFSKVWQSIYRASLADLTFWFVAAFFAVFLVKRPLTRPQKLALGTLDRRD